MSLTEHSDLKLEDKVTMIQSIEEKTSKNGNDYVLVTDISGAKFFVWSDGWQRILMRRKDFYRSQNVRINYVAEDPPYYCVLRYIYPVAWDDQNPEQNNFEVTMDMTEEDTDDNVVKTSDVSREERIVNQAGMHFGSRMLKVQADLGMLDDVESREDLQEEINTWASKFKRAAVTGELE